LKKFNASKIAGHVAEIRTKGFRATVAEHGVIDLASIMVGVIIVGILSAGIVATVFALIPFTQDKAAEQALSAVSTAESVQYSFSSGDGAGIYASLEDLNSVNNAADEILLQESNSIFIDTWGVDGIEGNTDDLETYVAYSVSPTGAVFSVDESGVKNAASALPTDVTYDAETGVFTDGRTP
jgi:type II secretory pathway pseudopilin PulG